MKIRDLLEVIVDEKDIFIKPAGKVLYYEGTAANVPCVLLDATIREISPRGHYNEDRTEPRRITTSIGIWVDNIPELDVLYYALGSLETYKSKEIDAMYGLVINDRERMMERLAKVAEFTSTFHYKKEDVPSELGWLIEVRDDAEDEVNEAKIKLKSLSVKVDPDSLIPIPDEMLVEDGECLDIIDIFVDKDKEDKQKKKPTISKKTEEFIEKLRNKENNVE